jgi:hypothetical protein
VDAIREFIQGEVDEAVDVVGDVCAQVLHRCVWWRVVECVKRVCMGEGERRGRVGVAYGD